MTKINQFIRPSRLERNIIARLIRYVNINDIFVCMLTRERYKGMHQINEVSHNHVRTSGTVRTDEGQLLMHLLLPITKLKDYVQI